MKRNVAFLIAGSVLSSGAANSAAQTVAAPSELHACVAKIGGFSRIVASRNDCVLEFETFVSWNSTGVAGAQGPAGAAGFSGSGGPVGLPGATGPTGPQGATGATGPTGSAGSSGAVRTFTAHGVFGYPIGFPSGPYNLLNFPIVGFTNGALGFNPYLPNSLQQFVTSCTATNFTLTAIAAKGSSAANISLLVAPTLAAPASAYISYPVCQIVTNNGQAVSCSAPGPIAIPAGAAAVFNVNLTNGSDFSNARLISSFACQ